MKIDDLLYLLRSFEVSILAIWKSCRQSRSFEIIATFVVCYSPIILNFILLFDFLLLLRENSINYYIFTISGSKNIFFSIKKLPLFTTFLAIKDHCWYGNVNHDHGEQRTSVVKIFVLQDADAKRPGIIREESLIHCNEIQCLCFPELEITSLDEKFKLFDEKYMCANVIHTIKHLILWNQLHNSCNKYALSTKLVIFQ